MTTDIFKASFHLDPLALVMMVLVALSQTISLPMLFRAYHRILKLSRTIADLDASDLIVQKHLLEALSYRLVKIM